MLMNLLHIFIFPGLLFVSVIGLLMTGIDRKLVARMQKRVGPPITQGFYDFFKLMGKETIIPEAANRKAFLAAPVIGYASLVVMVLFIPMFGFSVYSGTADMIVLIYLLTIPGVALIVGGTASGNPYAGVGASREMVTMIGYELPLILSVLAVCRKVGGGVLSFSLNEIVAWQAQNGCNLFHWALIPAALAFLLVIPGEVGTQPFDVAEAETEICEGPLIEYSGAPLAMFKLNTAVKMFIMPALFVALFLGGIHTGIAVLDVVIFVLLTGVVSFLSMTVPHAISARFKVEGLFKFYWTTVALLGVISLGLVWIGM